MTHHFLRLALLLFVAFVCYAQEFITGKVISVTDGDTIGILVDNSQVKIRLNGIDAPEAHQAFGTKAKQFVSDAVHGRTVEVATFGKDQYGRTLGDVLFEDGTTLAQKLVAAGLAWHYKEYSSDQTLARLENEARAAKVGLWSDPDPVAPWDFRRGKTAAEETAPQEAQGSDTVYVTRTGSKYHLGHCGYLRSSRIPILLSKAVLEYGPCSKCRPPTLEGAPATPNRSSTIETSPKSSGSMQCQATTKKGTQCSRRAKAGSSYCWQHGG